MPGYFVHLAAFRPNLLKNRSFVLGVEAPDILKKYYSMYGIEGAKEKYNKLKTNDMPDFSVFESRVCQKEKDGCRNGLHYGVSRNPDILYFWDNLSVEERNNPFWRGYLWHLLTDIVVYTNLDIHNKFELVLQEYVGPKSREQARKDELDKLHLDWDKTNAKLIKTYPEVSLTLEVEELDIVKFVDSDELFYVEWNVIKEAIDYLRRFEPLDDNIYQIICDILNSI